MSRIPVILTFCAILATTTSTPSIHSPRSHTLSSFTTVANKDTGTVSTNFAPNWPTCANDRLLSTLNPNPTSTVYVRPDCDAVISEICTAAAWEAANDVFMSSIGHRNRSCEGHILFSQSRLADPFDYATCVRGFQSVTETCILMGDPTVRNYAEVGRQAGVMNVFQNPEGGQAGNPVWRAGTAWNLMPGYMMGSPTWFGAVLGVEPSTMPYLIMR